jgi:predicted ATPase
MRITKLSLSNFKSFQKKQTIEFAPVTLLFGPNSVGKSSVLMSLFYLQEILEKGQCDLRQLNHLGRKNIQGFKSLVNGNDLNKKIEISIEYDKQGSIGKDYLEINDLLDSLNENVSSSSNTNAPLFMIDSPASSTDTVKVNFVIAWSFSEKTAFIESYSVELNNEFIIELTCDTGMKNPVVSKLNYFHPLLLPDNHDDWLQSELLNGNAFLHTKNKEIIAVNGVDFGDDDFDDDGTFSEFEHVMGGSQSFGFKGFAGALPILGAKLHTTLSLSSFHITQFTNEILSEIAVSPLDNLLSLLQSSLCIGPLRHVPDSNYIANPYPSQGDWYSGKACWDELITAELTRDAAINNWLIDKDKLNLGYKLVYKTSDIESRYITPSLELNSVEDALAISDAVGDKLQMTISKQNLDENPDAAQTPITQEALDEVRQGADFHSSLYVGQKIDKDTSISLWDCHNNIEVTASDIGVGVSQLLPLVVAAQVSNKGIIACEQPELHVHPRVQVAIGDLLTQSTSGANFLIETHSEHLILRLLRRIRETTDNELPEDFKAVTTSDVSIVYIEPDSDGVSVKNIKISDDGEFTTRWPNGFFSERREELF